MLKRLIVSIWSPKKSTRTGKPICCRPLAVDRVELARQVDINDAAAHGEVAGDLHLVPRRL